MIDAGLIRRLVDSQFPQWAGLPLRPVDPAGSDHVIHRLGDELAVRLPRHAGALGQAEKELRWLPRLAPSLPLAVPVPVAVGRPDFGYPWPWAISRWLAGEVATVAELGESVETAVALAGFLRALQHFPRTDAPPGDPRGLADRDADTRRAIEQVAGVFDGVDRTRVFDTAVGTPVFDAAALIRLWEAALNAPEWRRPPVWFHGDFHTGNLLTVDGRLSAVIDFGGLGAGDPARDMTIAFTLMSAGPRKVFREALGVDDDTWARGRGWALATGLNAYCAYAAGDARVAAQTVRQVTQALDG